MLCSSRVRRHHTYKSVVNLFWHRVLLADEQTQMGGPEERKEDVLTPGVAPGVLSVG